MASNTNPRQKAYDAMKKMGIKESVALAKKTPQDIAMEKLMAEREAYANANNGMWPSDAELMAARKGKKNVR